MEPCCHRFTAAEGGARLAVTASVGNTLATECGSFISTRLLHEEAYNIRGPLSANKKRSVRICRLSNVKPDAYELRILTDLKITEAVEFDDVQDWNEELETKEVLVCTSQVLKLIMEKDILKMTQINVLVIDSCHLIYKDENLQYIMQIYKATNELDRPRILALTYPLFSSKTKPIDNQKDSENSIDNVDKEIEEKEKETTDNESEEIIDNKVPPKEVVNELSLYENLDDFEMYEKLEWQIDRLEKELCCKMDLAEDIDGFKRLSGPVAKPRELLIEYNTRPSNEELLDDYVLLEKFMKDNVFDVLEFLNDHRHDPTEIYGEDLYEELKSIPDPTVEPKQILHEFLYILDELGPFAADKAAFSLLIKLEKLKIKIPYERHFLLLRLCTTVFVKIRCFTEIVLAKYESEWDKISLFSTPKLMRLVEILEMFTPPVVEKPEGDVTDANNEANVNPDNINTDSNTDGKLNDETGKIDGKTDNPDQESVNKTDCNKNDKPDCNEIDGSHDNVFNNFKTKELDSEIVKRDLNLDFSEKTTTNSSNNHSLDKTVKDKLLNDIDGCEFSKLGDRIEDKINILTTNLKEINLDAVAKEDINVKPDERPFRRSGRVRRGRPPRNNARLTQINPNALCGIIFMKHALMAKILFMIVVDLTRVKSTLSYITCQYCAVEPILEQKENQKQGKRHEEVLKKFRMHECNLLLTTSALEEGIDLPRCNLVLRWDQPPSYRSYVLCRGRGRAGRAGAALLCAGNNTQPILHNLATYTELDAIVSRKCGCGIQDEPTAEEESHADLYTSIIKPYVPNETLCTCNKEQNNDLLKESSLNLELETSNEERSEDLKLEHNLIHSLTDRIESNLNSELQTSNKECSKDLKIEQNSISKLSHLSLECNSNLKMEVNSHETVLNHFEHNEVCDLKKEKDNLKLESKVLNSDVNCTNGSKENSVVCDSCLKKTDENLASVDLSTAIALINRYCAKLPSDTFTRLAPQWWSEKVRIPGQEQDSYVCTLRLPLNCPVKYNIVGHPMPTRVLARRMVALQACRILHKSGELDNQLMPIGKENFKAVELDTNVLNANEKDLDDSARPGTTKRRQYYYKRTAWAFTDCQPITDVSDLEIEGNPKENSEENTTKEKDVQTKDTGNKRNTLYLLSCSLCCALPERYNTRGRRLHAPQHSDTALAILMARDNTEHLQIPAFPVYTRSGEVRVCVEHVPDADVRLSPRRGRLVRRFMRFVFTEVLRVRRRGMKLQSEGSTKNNYYIVPTIKTTKPDGTSKIDIDWAFLELIYQHTEDKKLSEIEKPILWYQDEEENYLAQKEGEEESGEVLRNPLLKPGEVFTFDADKYKEAVVTPWYRNRDQPQFFLVAEICWNLSPDSAFPSSSHATFRSYYQDKYKVELTQPEQPLLDVDHTSARLNLLTPRYVNRKGVALPVSSERTRRNKRDRLDQKQILVPELCRRHPFAAPLWFATVALPCVLYRINALLIADEIRRAVAVDVGLGIPKIDNNTMPGFQWPPLDFGWSLAEVLSADAEKNEKKKEEEREKEQKDREIRQTEDQNKESEVNKEETEEKEKTINDILQEKEDAENSFEIGTWSNDMASSIPEAVEYDELMEPLPSNLTLCTTASGGVNWCDPIQKKQEYNRNYQRTFSMADSDCSFMSSDFDTDDSDFDSEGSDDDTDASGFCNSKNSNAAVGVRIEYKTAHEAEAVDVERKKKTVPSPQRDPEDEKVDREELAELLTSGTPEQQYIDRFRTSVETHKANIIKNGQIIHSNEPIIDILPPTKSTDKRPTTTIDKLKEIFPKTDLIQISNGQITIDSIERNKRLLMEEFKKSLPESEVRKLNCFSMVDVDIDSKSYVNEKIVNVGFDTKEKYMEKILNYKGRDAVPFYMENKDGKFDFDHQPDLEGHPGPSPSVILQALTMSNANDGINLERLETIGDSFLKFAITAYLYCAHPTVHEGKLSHMRSKQVSNLNLYRLGRGVKLGARMIASKFEPHDNWLPPCHRPPPSPHSHDKPDCKESVKSTEIQRDASGCYIPYNLITQHSIPDKSIADCVEALIGAYLVECGARGALLFMSWLGIKVLPHHIVKLDKPPEENVRKPPPPPSPKRTRTCSGSSTSCSDLSDDESDDESCCEPNNTDYIGPVGAKPPYQDENGDWVQLVYGELKAPPSPLLRYIEDPEGELEQMLSGYEQLEATLKYRFKDRSLLLQALTHASHQRNRLTDCYQRLEFLGDAILDYVITRHLFEDRRRHSPGALTDLRSALVNNTIFATLAVRHGFHKYFRHMSPGLNEVLTKYVKIQEENGHSISEEHYLIQEDELEQAEDVEVPKALGDLFESVAGAIFLDSGMSLGAVWQSYVRLMGAELEAFSAAAPKSPVRELLEAEPDTAKFGKPERLADGRRVRVCVEVFGRGTFKGIGRNYRIAKGTAARCALRHLKIHRR